MVALLWIRRGMPSKLPATSAGAMHRNGADRLADGGHLSPDHSPTAPDQPPIAGSLSARRSLRARSTNCHRTAGGTTGPAVGEILPGSGEPRLAKHLRHEQPYLFTFLHCPGLDATNHQAEQAVRWMVIARKVWGGNRTWAGAQTQQILVSIMRTCWQQERDAFPLLQRSRDTHILDIVPAA